METEKIAQFFSEFYRKQKIMHKQKKKVNENSEGKE
jgi:hypothetical protein